jgi:tRNA nucleotidyltransferase (CCA-adding enzyme)
MREDRLRALRGLRFASRFDFVIDEKTLAAIRDSAPHLGRLSAERVKQEIEKTMDQVRLPGVAFAMWKSTGAFGTLIPALATTSDEALAVTNYLAMPGMATRPRRRLIRLAGLFASLDPSEVTRTLTDLRFSKQDTQWISTVVGRWREVGPGIEVALGTRVAPSDATVRGWVARTGRLHMGPVMRLAVAVWSARIAAGGRAPDLRTAQRLYRRMSRIAFRDPIDLRDLAVDGDDLKRAGVSGGPRLGQILQALLRDVLEDPSLNRTDWLLQQAIRLHHGDVIGATKKRGDGD